MSSYVIYSLSLGKYFEDNIKEVKYLELKQSHEILRECKSVENMYNIVLINYYEFEEELYKISLNDEVFNGSYSIFNSYITKVEQRLLNLLASVTLYLDFFKEEKNVNKFSEYVKDVFAEVHVFIQEQNKDNQRIQIVKYLRNHIQHNGLIIKNFSLNGKNLTKQLREQTLNFSIDKYSIKANWYNPDNFSELNNDIDLKQYIREYIDYISNVHKTFREATGGKVTKARACFEEIIQEHEESEIVYIAETEDGQKTNELAILLDWDDVRVEMTKKNHVPKAFSRHSINTKSTGQEND